MSTEITPRSSRLPKSDERSVKQLVHDVKQDATLLARQELALKKAQLKEKATVVAKKGAMFGGAALLGYAGLLVLLAALVLAVIALGVVAWLAALSVGVVVVLGAYLIIQRARRPMKSSRP